LWPIKLWFFNHFPFQLNVQEKSDTFSIHKNIYTRAWQQFVTKSWHKKSISHRTIRRYLHFQF